MPPAVSNDHLWRSGPYHPEVGWSGGWSGGWSIGTAGGILTDHHPFFLLLPNGWMVVGHPMPDHPPDHPVVGRVVVWHRGRQITRAP